MPLCSGRNRSCCRPTTPCRPCTPSTCCRPQCSCRNCKCQDQKKKKESKKKEEKCTRIGCSEKMPCVSCCRKGPEKTKHPSVCKKCKSFDCECKVKKSKKSK